MGKGTGTGGRMLLPLAAGGPAASLCVAAPLRAAAEAPSRPAGTHRYTYLLYQAIPTYQAVPTYPGSIYYYGYTDSAYMLRRPLPPSSVPSTIRSSRSVAAGAVSTRPPAARRCTTGTMRSSTSHTPTVGEGNGRRTVRGHPRRGRNCDAIANRL